MTENIAKSSLIFLIIALLVGVTIPGEWRDGIVTYFNLPPVISSWLHFSLFLGIAVVTTSHPIKRTFKFAIVSAIGLGILSEALQFISLDRHPRWIDVGIDVTGAFCGSLTVLLKNLLAENYNKWKEIFKRHER
jgi:hypothetical protein